MAGDWKLRDTAATIRPDAALGGSRHAHVGGRWNRKEGVDGQASIADLRLLQQLFNR